jgi:DNA repair protein RadD
VVTPRDYQERAIQETIARLPERPILVSPTGSGKTFMAVQIVSRLGVRALVIAHRRELILQAAGALTRNGARVGVIMAQQTPDPSAPVQVASIQTLAKRPLPRVGLVIIDECHHARAACYERALTHYQEQGAHVMGLTASPFRLDGKGLGDIFGGIVVAAYPDELVDDGTLVEPVVYAPDVPNLAGVRIQHGEYNLKTLGETMGKPKLVGDIVETWQKRAHGRRTVVFAVNVEHSNQIVEAFKAAGVRAEHLDGATPRAQRDAILHRLKVGYTTVVSNCQVLTEGWDLPALEVAIIARPTASLCLHLQTIGRIMRCAPEKSGAIVLDHAGNHLRHGPVTQRLEYSLEDAVAPKAAGTPNAAPSKRCPECYLVVNAGARECGGCGYVFRTEVPESTAGELVEYSGAKARPPLEEQQRVWDEIEERRRHWDFAPGWTFVQFRQRMGFTPVVLDGRVIDGATAPHRALEQEYERLAEVARIRGYKPGWIGHQLASKFGGRAWAYVQRRRTA